MNINELVSLKPVIMVAARLPFNHFSPKSHSHQEKNGRETENFFWCLNFSFDLFSLLRSLSLSVSRPLQLNLMLVPKRGTDLVF